MNSEPVKRRSVIMIIVMDLVAFGIGVPLLVAGVLENGYDAQGMAASGATLCTLGLLVHRWRPLLRQIGAKNSSSGDDDPSKVGSKVLMLAIGFMLMLGLLGRVNTQADRKFDDMDSRLDDVQGQVNNLEYERFR